MVTIRFTQDRVVQDGDRGTPHETRFSAGQVVDLAEASANHWLSRGAAERVLAAEEPAAPLAPSASSVETQPSLDLTGAPAGDAGEQPPKDEDGASNEETSAVAPDASAEDGSPAASEAQPGLDLSGAQPGEAENAGDAGAPGGGQAGASGKSERRPARAAAKGVKA
jgi:hypothetical protein